MSTPLSNIRRATLVLATTSAIAFATASTLAGCASGSSSPAGDLAQRVAAAQTRAEHAALAESFAQEATRARGDAEQHRKMARAYQARMDKGAGAMVAHCNSLVRSSEAAAADFESMAAAHRQLAEQART